jgi:hypothetical protein
MPITIDPSAISIGSDAAVVIRDDALRKKVRTAFGDKSQSFLASFVREANLGCTNEGNCADEKNLGSCVNTGVCFF